MTDSRLSASELFEQVRKAKLVDQRKTSFPFDPYLKTTNTHALNLIELATDDLCAQWVKQFDRQPSVSTQHKFWECCIAILANLLRAERNPGPTTVGMYRSKGALDRLKRYRPASMTANRLIAVQDCLVESGLMVKREEGYNFPGFSQTGRYGLTERGVSFLQADNWSFTDFAVEQCGETIQLKDAEGHLCGYEDTPETNIMRSRLAKINKQLSSCKIDTLNPLISIDKKEGYRLHAVSLHRVFNRGAFDYGGRFVGGWWQNIRSEARRLIMIDGQPTIEADFTGFNPAALLAENGQTIPPDPYKLIEGVNGSPVLRDHAKDTLAALLNTRSGRTDEPSNFDAVKWKMRPEEFRERVLDAFPMVRSMMRNNAGMMLQRKESDLAEAIMLHFVKQGHTILPIHDAFIVQAHMRDELVQVMKAEFRAMFGQEPKVKVIPHQSQQ